jgi:putative redox protein
VEGERADEHPKVYNTVKLEYIVSGYDLSEDAVRDSIALSQDKYCSASAMFAQTAQLSYSYRIIEKEEENVTTVN